MSSSITDRINQLNQSKSQDASKTANTKAASSTSNVTSTSQNLKSHHLQGVAMKEKVVSMSQGSTSMSNSTVSSSTTEKITISRSSRSMSTTSTVSIISKDNVRITSSSPRTTEDFLGASALKQSVDQVKAGSWQTFVKTPSKSSVEFFTMTSLISVSSGIAKSSQTNDKAPPKPSAEVITRTSLGSISSSKPKSLQSSDTVLAKASGGQVPARNSVSQPKASLVASAVPDRSVPTKPSIKVSTTVSQLATTFEKSGVNPATPVTPKRPSSFIAVKETSISTTERKSHVSISIVNINQIKAKLDTTNDDIESVAVGKCSSASSSSRRREDDEKKDATNSASATFEKEKPRASVTPSPAATAKTTERALVIPFPATTAHTSERKPHVSTGSVNISQIKAKLDTTNVDIGSVAVGKRTSPPSHRWRDSNEEEQGSTNPVSASLEKPRASVTPSPAMVSRPPSGGQRASLAGARADEFRHVCNVEALDRIATNDVGTDVRSSIPRLAGHLATLAHAHCSALRLNDRAHVDFALLRVLYRWVAHNIVYDTVSLYAGTVTSAKCEPEYVLRSGMGVCSGYSRLLNAMADCAGLKMRCASGWAKGADYKVGDVPRTQVVKSNHEWNIITLGGMDYHVDVTWSAGHTNGKFVRMWNEHYFLTPAETFVQDHLPELAEDQFLVPPLSLNEYCASPDVKPSFFLAGMQFKCDRSKSGVLQARPGMKVELNFAIREDWIVFSPSISSKKYRGKEKAGSVHRVSDTHTTVLFDAPDECGEYFLMLFVMPKAGRQGDGAVEYLIRVE